MNLEVTGKLAVKYDTQQVKESFKKREFVLELSEEINGNVYTNFAKLQLVQAKCDILDRFNVGDQVKVSFNLKGNKWEKDGKVNYITNLDAWRIEAVATGAPNAAPSMPAYNTAGASGASAPANNGNFYNPAPENADDLPF
ncbi:MAG TPA: DUF3127 domain-containing protein [Flavipsychrobacter sp.]|nr:DUF3127 domain-containing protein [Flavipsychrobacter sp.]